MTDTDLGALADAIEATLTIDETLASQALAAINSLEGQSFGAADLDATDRILALIYAELPGWTVQMKGKAWQPNGHWVCTLRRSSARDSDEYLGIGRGPTLAHSLLAAMLRVLSYKR